MGALEEIQQAIETLTKLRAGDVALPWEMDGRFIRSDGWILAQVLKAGNETTADLIVTLHRTIDAQLAILADALKALANPLPLFILNGRDMTPNVYHAQIELARAINRGA